jgi:hypothetical protein
MNRREFKAKVNAVMDSGNLALSKHVREDHPERAIDPLEIQQCIKLGTIQGDPYLTVRGDWKGEFYRHAAGHGLTVVVALIRETKAVVVTAIR